MVYTKPADGFMLIEMGIVIGLLLIMLMISVPHISFLRRFCVAAEIEKMAQFFHFCAQRAIISGKPQRLTFDPQTNTYSCGSFKEMLMPGVCFGAADNVYGPPSHPVHPISQPITFNQREVLFYPDGAMQSGAVYITDQERSCTYALTAPISSIAYMRKYCFSYKQWALLN